MKDILVNRLWSPFEVEQDQVYYWLVGPFKVWIIKKSDEWLVAFDYIEVETGLVHPEQEPRIFCSKPDSLEWHRIVGEVDDPRITLVPVMDSKPIVVGADVPFKILPHNRALIFINVPIVLRIRAGFKKQVTLMEIPTFQLSKTWVGSLDTGELCLSLKTSAVRMKEQLQPKPNRAGCPVLIKNSSCEILEIKKICVHTENLGIYLGDSRLWTNKVEISYQGSERSSEMKKINGPPKMDSDEGLLCSPPVDSKHGILKKSFNLFKQLYLN